MLLYCNRTARNDGRFYGQSNDRSRERPTACSHGHKYIYTIILYTTTTSRKDVVLFLIVLLFCQILVSWLELQSIGELDSVLTFTRTLLTSVWEL